MWKKVFRRDNDGSLSQVPVTLRPDLFQLEKLLPEFEENFSQSLLGLVRITESLAFSDHMLKKILVEVCENIEGKNEWKRQPQFSESFSLSLVSFCFFHRVIPRPTRPGTNHETTLCTFFSVGNFATEIGATVHFTRTEQHRHTTRGL